MSFPANCPYADSHRFSAKSGGLRTAITKKEVLRAEEEIEAIASASSLRYYTANNVALIGEPDGSPESRACNAMLEAWTALDNSVWDMAGSMDRMREAVWQLEEEMQSTNRVMLRMEDEKGAINKALERRIPEIREAIRKDQKRMRREDEEFLREKRERAGDFGSIQRPWVERPREKRRRLEKKARKPSYWGARREMGWGGGGDGWSDKANYEPSRGEGSSSKMEPSKEEWEDLGGKENADAEWWNGHYDDES